jgi:hypothetical protein
MPTLAFPPSYFHRVIRLGTTSTNPIAHIDLRPWGEEIAHNLQLLQDRVRTETLVILSHLSDHGLMEASSDLKVTIIT